MSDNRPPRPSYSQAMSQWSSNREGRQSFRDRSRTSMLAPDAFAHPVSRVLGYLWRLGLLALVGALVYWLLLRAHLAGDAFARQLAGETQKLLNADSVTIPKVDWRGESGAIRRLQATGGTGTFFRSLEAGNVSFKVPLGMLWSKEWRFRRVSIGSLEVVLRSGGLGNAQGVGLTEIEKETVPEGFAEPPPTVIQADLGLDAAAPAEPKQEAPATERKALDLRLMKDGFGVAPDFERVQINAIDVNKLQMQWGRSESTLGGLREGSLNATREDTGGWAFEIPSATLDQNWLRGLQVKGLRARYAGGTIEFDETAVQVGEGAATLSGRVSTGEVPRFDLKLKADKLPFERFFGDPFDGFLNLSASGDLAIGGSTNLASGITIKGDLVIDAGSLRTLPILDALVNVSGRVRFREIEFTSGHFTLATGEGRLEVTDFEVKSREDVVLKGAFTWQKGVFSGTLQIGCDPLLLQKVPESVRTAFFKPEADGKLWVTTALEGPLEALTKEANGRMIGAMQHRPAR